MKHFNFLIKILFVVLFYQGIYVNVWAQTNSANDFWFTFGKRLNDHSSEMQIRIVNGDLATTGTIYFTHLGTSVSFDLASREVYSYRLNSTEREAVYSPDPGVSSCSVHITSTHQISVYTLDQRNSSTEATQIVPLEDLGTNYYHISYKPSNPYLDAYSVVGTKDNTKLYHNGTLAATINSGQVYYKTSNSDMTGALITANQPVAFFAVNQGPQIPQGYNAVDCLLEQLAPVSAYGEVFFVPVSILTRDIVRIVASQNNTNITQSGGTLLFPAGGQTSLNNLQAGQFVELEVSLNNKGCFIQADKPVGVCTYLTSDDYNKPIVSNIGSDPALCWLPPIEKTFNHVLIAPFVSNNPSNISHHMALVVTPTVAKNETTVSIGGGGAYALSGGNWIDHAQAKISFYNMPLTNLSASYLFANSAGLNILCYGVGDRESYYYNTSAFMQDLEASFFVNNIYYQTLENHTFCAGDITFRAQINGMNESPGSLKWYVDDIEEIAARDQLIWNKYFSSGNYNIKMTVRFINENSITLESPLHISNYQISATPAPPEGGNIEGLGCYLMNEEATLKAIPNFGYNFVKWTENGNDIFFEDILKITVTESRDFKAHFEVKTYDVALSADPPEWGSVAGDDTNIPHGTSVTVTATPNDTYMFVNWTEKGVEVSTDTAYSFEIMNDRNLVAHFTPKTSEIKVAANPTDGGTVTGNATNIPYGAEHTVSATANEAFFFVNWTEKDAIVSTENPYTFLVTDSRALVANFTKSQCTVTIEVNDPDYGYATGAGTYDALDAVKAEAFGNDCYPFVNWTIDSIEVSTDNPYIFTITESVNLVANFLALDFDTCTLTLWNNTFLLNLRWLRENGYVVTGCRWFKNGKELLELNTIDEYSYCAGTNGEPLEPAPTYYTFQVNTSNFGCINSTKKMITQNNAAGTGKLLVYPNPVGSGAQFIIEGVSINSPIYVYNFMGVCVGSAIATDSTTKLTLSVPAGIYLIRSENKEAKIVIVE